MVDDPKTVKLEIAAINGVLKRFEAVKKHFVNTVNKEREKVAARITAMLDYKTEEEAADAFGWGYITEVEYKAILERLDGAEQAAAKETKNTMALAYCLDAIRRLENTRREFEWSLLSDAEKQRRTEAREDIARRVQERKNR